MTEIKRNGTVSTPSRKNKKMRSQKTATIMGKIVVYAVLTLYAAIIIFPFLIVLLTSLKTRIDSQSLVFQLIPPMGFTAEGYTQAFAFKPQWDATMPALIQGFFNTLLYIIPPTVMGLFTSSLSAYAFSKLRFRAKRVMYTALLATMMVPGMIMLAPSLAIFDMLGWVDTPLPLMIPGMFGAAACVFFMRQFYSGIPDSLVEAAKIDGLGFIGIFFRIMVPLSVPALLAQGLLGFIGGYNDFLNPLIYLHSSDLWTLQIVLTTLSSNRPNDYNVVMAGCLIALLPMLLLYFVCQKFFINGIVSSGLKD